MLLISPTTVTHPKACRATDNCLNFNIRLNILPLGLNMYYKNFCWLQIKFKVNLRLVISILTRERHFICIFF